MNVENGGEIVHISLKSRHFTINLGLSQYVGSGQIEIAGSSPLKPKMNVCN